MQQVKLYSGSGYATAIVKDETEHLQKWWRKQKFYEAEMLEWIRRHYSGGTFVDVGSCIGNHTLYFATFCDPDRVISIEPVRSSFEHQREVLALNGLLDEVKMHNVALSDESGRGYMVPFAPVGHVNAGMYQLETLPGRAGAWKHQSDSAKGGDDIKVTTLDAVLKRERVDDVTLVKIDVEYHELQVLRGAVKLLETQHPALFVELSPTGSYYADTVGFLAQFGYEVRSQHNISPTYEFVVGHKIAPAGKSLPMANEGEVLLEYVGRNVGLQTWAGSVTHREYKFDCKKHKRGVILKPDVPGLLAAKNKAGKRLFRRAK